MSEASQQMSMARKAVRKAVLQRGEYDISYMHKVAIDALRNTTMPDCIIDSMAEQAARDVYFSPRRKQEALRHALNIFQAIA